jgi:hypothetical protein
MSHSTTLFVEAIPVSHTVDPEQKIQELFFSSLDANQPLSNARVAVVGKKISGKTTFLYNLLKVKLKTKLANVNRSKLEVIYVSDVPQDPSSIPFKCLCVLHSVPFRVESCVDWKRWSVAKGSNSAKTNEPMQILGSSNEQAQKLARAVNEEEKKHDMQDVPPVYKPQTDTEYVLIVENSSAASHKHFLEWCLYSEGREPISIFASMTDAFDSNSTKELPSSDKPFKFTHLCQTSHEGSWAVQCTMLLQSK